MIHNGIKLTAIADIFALQYRSVFLLWLMASIQTMSEIRYHSRAGKVRSIAQFIGIIFQGALCPTN